jgi:hypothetical protein
VGEKILDVRSHEAAWVEEKADALDDAVDVGDVGHHVVRQYEVGHPPLVDQAPGEIGAEELAHRGDAALLGHGGDVACGLDPNTDMPALAILRR